MIGCRDGRAGIKAAIDRLGPGGARSDLRHVDVESNALERPAGVLLYQGAFTGICGIEMRIGTHAWRAEEATDGPGARPAGCRGPRVPNDARARPTRNDDTSVEHCRFGWIRGGEVVIDRG